jgi:hypothetical protein
VSKPNVIDQCPHVVVDRPAAPPHEDAALLKAVRDARPSPPSTTKRVAPELADVSRSRERVVHRRAIRIHHRPNG